MRLLWVVARLTGRDTGGMAGDAEPTAFVTGAASFLGQELVQLLVARGYRVLGLARSAASARLLQRAGATAVTGDLLAPGAWQDEAAADWVFHIAPCSRSTTRAWNHSESRARAAMDAHLLDAVAAGATRRVVYVSDPGYPDRADARPITEDELPPPGGCRARSLARVEGYAIAGLPVVTALPGCLYGNGSWFREHVVDRVMAGRHVLQFGMAGSWVSPIHVHDCAQALVHLAERGQIGNRYFIANNEPARLGEFAAVFARLADRPLRVWRLPVAAAPFLVGRPLADYVRTNALLSNIRLRGIGFRFRYLTIERGIEQVVGALHE